MLTLLSAALAAPPLEAVVLLEQGATVCAGALVDEHGLVATSYHCVAAGGRPAVSTRRGKYAIGRVVALDRAHDLALVEVPELAGEPWLPVRTKPIAVGEACWALGHPMGAQLPVGFLAGTLRWSASDGVVSAVGDNALQVSAPVNSGNSGGPIVDADGLLIGIVSRRIPGDGLGFATRAELVEALIGKERRPMSPLGGTVGAELVGMMLTTDDGTFTAGGRVEASMRDRLVVAGMFALPFQPKWDATRFGSVSWVPAELEVGLRQRLFRGQLAMKLDVYAGRPLLQRMSTDADGRLRSSSDAGFSLGGSLDLAGVGLGFDVARVWFPDESGYRAAIVYSWPGTWWMF